MKEGATSAILFQVQMSLPLYRLYTCFLMHIFPMSVGLSIQMEVPVMEKEKLPVLVKGLVYEVT